MVKCFEGCKHRTKPNFCDAYKCRIDIIFEQVDDDCKRYKKKKGRKRVGSNGKVFNFAGNNSNYMG